MLKNTARVILQLYQQHISSTEIMEQLTKHKAIQRYAWILHDKDNAKPHYHVMIDFGRSYPIDRIPGWFPNHPGIIESNLMEPVRSWSAFVQYLIHKNEPDKFQYAIQEITANYDLTDDLEAPRDHLPVWFGDFYQVEYLDHMLWISQNVVNLKRRNKLHDEVTKGYQYYITVREDEERNMRVMFVQGPSGIGKTTFARWWAKVNLKKSYFVSGSDNDPLDGYMGQKVLILDDLRDDTEWTRSFSNLLKVLDNHTGSLIKARYKNKRFDGDWIIITSIKPLSEWYKNTFTSEREPMQQLYRRITDYVELVQEPGQDLPTAYYFDRVSNETGRPLETILTERISFDVSLLIRDLQSTVDQAVEIQDKINNLKQVMKNEV